MSVCLVTGGAGFIGSHLVEALVARHHAVRVLDNCTTGTLANLAGVMNAVELYLGDLADLDFVRRVTSGVEFVFHHAAQTWEGAAPPGGAGRPALEAVPVPLLPTSPPHHPESFALPEEEAEEVCRVKRRTPTTADDPRDAGPPGWGPDADVLGTMHVLTAAREAGVRRVVYASSIRAFGQPSGLPCREEDPARPLGPYALAKLGGEQACLACTRLHGLETVCLRYGHVFGPRQPAHGPYAAVVREALSAMLAGRPPVLAGDGLRGQDLIFVDDAVHATLLAAWAPRVSGKVYNVARGRPTTPREVVAALNSLLGTQFEPLYVPHDPDDLDNLASTARAEVDLGFFASTDLEQGLRRCIESWRQAAPPVPEACRRSLSPNCGS
jgi:UDP-glucose 4-epimerase